MHTSARFQLTIAAIAAALCIASLPAWASFGGRFDLGFTGALIAASILALPGGAICAVIEWIGARRAPPDWIGLLFGAAGMYCAAAGLGLLPGGDKTPYWFLVPPLFSLALVALVRASAWRGVAAWLLAGGALALAALKPWPLLQPDRYRELMGALAGGALSSMLMWQLAHWLRRLQIAQASKGVDARAAESSTPSPAETARAATETTAALARQAAEGARAATSGAAAAMRRMPSGVGWFAAGALIFYVAIGLLVAFGFGALFEAMRGLEWQIADFFGFPTRGLEGRPLRVWAEHGVAWSMIAGLGAWGAAAVAGRFDPGSLRYLRFAAVVICGVMLLSVAMIASRTKLY